MSGGKRNAERLAKRARELDGTPPMNRAEARRAARRMLNRRDPKAGKAQGDTTRGAVTKLSQALRPGQLKIVGTGSTDPT